MATLFTIGQQTGSKRYSSWNVSSSDFNIDDVDISNIYTDYDLTALGESRTVKNNVGCLRTTKPFRVMNGAVWTFNFRYDITSVHLLWKTSQSASAELRQNDNWVSISANRRTVTLHTDVFQDYGNCYMLLLVNEPLGSTTHTYTETLQNIVSDGADSYNDGDTFTIHYTANDGYLITSLTSNIGTVTIADDKRSAVLAGSATENIVVEGVATQYGNIVITGSFVHCSCNYSNGETISPSKPRLEIVADNGFLFLKDFRYKQGVTTKYLNKSADNKMLYKDLDTRGLNLNDVYTAEAEAGKSYTYTETLQNIVSDGAESYNAGDTFTIHYTANDGYLIESLTSNIGTVTIADDKRSAVLAGSATENIVVEGVATTEYGTILITGSFVHCSCNYSNGEIISPSKPRLEIVADDGFIFLNEFGYKQAGVTKTLNKSDDNKMLYKDLTNKRGLNLNDTYTAVTAPKTMTSFVHLYKTNDNELSALAKARFKDVSGNTVDYGQYISALYRIPVDLSNITGDTSNIMLGQYDSMVASTLLNQYLVDIDGGTITIPEKFNNAYDYLTTECILHLPFLDDIPLSPQYVVNQTINIKYKLDLYSGTMTASIYSSYLNSIVANTSGVIVTNIPFIQKLTDNVVNSLTKVFTNLIPTAFMEVTRNIPYDNVNVFGKECVDFDMIGNKTGYLKCDNVALVTKATKNEKDEIMSLLKEGIIL